MSINKKSDYDYYKMMTWNWYAIQYIGQSKYVKNKTKYWYGMDLKYCKKCKNVYSINSTTGGNRAYQPFNYSNISSRSIKRKECYECTGKNVVVMDY